MARLLKIIWVVACVLVLLMAFWFFDGKSNSDTDIFLVYAMNLLTFPIGLICTTLIFYVLKIVYDFFSIQIVSSYLSIFFFWIIFFFSGYYQYFKVLPFLRNIKRNKE